VARYLLCLQDLVVCEIAETAPQTRLTLSLDETSAEA
jgi:hypothetical protein